MFRLAIVFTRVGGWVGESDQSDSSVGSFRVQGT